MNRMWRSGQGHGSSGHNNNRSSTSSLTTRSSSSSSTSRSSSVQNRRGGAMSSQTRRILQELERISSPVVDTRRSLADAHRWNPESVIDHGRSLWDARPSTSGSTCPSPGRIRGPPLSSFHTPTRAEILPPVASVSSISAAHPYLSRRGAESSRFGGRRMKSATSSRFSYGIDSLDEGQQQDLADAVPLVTFPISVDRLPPSGFLVGDTKSSAGGSSRAANLSSSVSLPVEKKRTGSVSEEDDVPMFSFSKPRSMSRGYSSSSLRPFRSGIGSESVSALKKETDISETGSTSSDDSFVSTEMNSSEKDSSAEKIKEDKRKVLDAERSWTKSASDRVLSSEKWKCSACHFNNQLTDSQCSQCLQQKDPSTVERWTCKKCRLDNSAAVDQCISCSADKHYVSPPKSLAESEGWTCEVCLVPNKNRETCVCCSSAKPANDKEAWKCKKCQLENKGSVGSCICCGADKNYVATPVASKSTEWTCSMCLVPNRKEDNYCVCCQTPKASDEKSRLTSAQTWSCDTCLTRNNSEALACVSCEAPRAAGVAKISAVNGNAAFQKTDFSSAFASSDWSCTACFVKNPGKSLTCHACSVAKPVSSFSPVSFGIGAGPEKGNSGSDAGVSAFNTKPPFGLVPSSTAVEITAANEKKSVRFADTVSFSVTPTTDSLSTTQPAFGFPSVSADKNRPPSFGLSQYTSSGGALSKAAESGVSVNGLSTTSVLAPATVVSTSPGAMTTASVSTSILTIPLAVNAVETAITTTAPIAAKSGPLFTFGNAESTAPKIGSFAFPSSSSAGVSSGTTTTAASEPLIFSFGQKIETQQKTEADKTAAKFGEEGQFTLGTNSEKLASSGAPAVNFQSLFNANSATAGKSAAPIFGFQSTGTGNVSNSLFGASSGKRAAGSDSDEPRAKKPQFPSTTGGFGQGFGGSGSVSSATGFINGSSMFGAPAPLTKDSTQVVGTNGKKSEAESQPGPEASAISFLGSTAGGKAPEFKLDQSAVSNGPTSFGIPEKKEPSGYQFGNSLFGKPDSTVNNAAGLGSSNFQFGSVTKTSGSEAPVPAVFNFAAAASVADSTSHPFQFGSDATPNNPFSLGSVTGNAAPRQTLKARRKITRR